MSSDRTSSIRSAEDDVLFSSLDYGLEISESVATSVLDERWNWSQNGSVDRLRAKLLLRRGELRAAQHWLDEAIASSRERGIELELGRCFQDAAALAEAHGDHPATREHFGRAGEIYSRLGAGGYLQEVIAQRGILGA